MEKADNIEHLLGQLEPYEQHRIDKIYFLDSDNIHVCNLRRLSYNLSYKLPVLYTGNFAVSTDMCFFSTSHRIEC